MPAFGKALGHFLPTIWSDDPRQKFVAGTFMNRRQIFTPQKVSWIKQWIVGVIASHFENLQLRSNSFWSTEPRSKVDQSVFR
jgi:hypothetical protein